METLLCTICNNTATKWCSQCHGSKYCSKECQKKDWPQQKKYCEPGYFDDTKEGTKETRAFTSIKICQFIFAYTRYSERSATSEFENIINPSM